MSSPIALFAGSGNLPLHVIQALKARNHPFFVVAFEGLTPPSHVEGCTHEWFSVGKLAPLYEALHKHNITEALFAGYFPRPQWSALHLDWEGTKLLGKILSRPHIGDDALLRLVIEALEKRGVSVLPLTSFLMPLKGTLGPMGQHHPFDYKGIERAKEILTALSAADVGQAVVIQGDRVLGIEAIEGTDQLILRSSALKEGLEKPILVKMPKKNQDLRADLPCVGIQTMDLLIQEDYGGLVIGIDHTIMMDKSEMIHRADEAGLFIVGI